LASSPNSASWATASSTEDTRTYSNADAFTVSRLQSALYSCHLSC
jgi:hypothetical protein